MKKLNKKFDEVCDEVIDIIMEKDILTNRYCVNMYNVQTQTIDLDFNNVLRDLIYGLKEIEDNIYFVLSMIFPIIEGLTENMDSMLLDAEEDATRFMGIRAKRLHFNVDEVVEEFVKEANALSLSKIKEFF